MQRLAVVVAFTSVAACKGKPTPAEQPPSAKVETQGSNKVSGSANPTSKDLQLPHGPGTPPVKTTAAMSTATMKHLQDLEFPGFQKELHGFQPRWMEVRQRTEDHPKIMLTISLQPCEPDKDTIWKCIPLDLDQWQKRKDELMTIVNDKLRGAADTTFEIGKTDLHGAPMIYTYQLGYKVEGGESNYTDAYALYYNDGQNAVRVVAQYADDLTRTRADMEKLAPKSDLEKFAKSFMDVYTQAWGEAPAK